MAGGCYGVLSASKPHIIRLFNVAFLHSPWNPIYPFNWSLSLQMQFNSNLSLKFLIIPCTHHIKSTFPICFGKVPKKALLKKWPPRGRWYAPKCVTPGVSAWSHWSSINISIKVKNVKQYISSSSLSSCLMSHISCLMYHVSCHLTFHVIWHFLQVKS